jgi:polyisoprenoid-binding protein YceI
VSARRVAAALALAAALAGTGCALVRHRDVSGVWRLVPVESALHFVGIKNNAVGVPGTFTTLEGAYDAAKRSGFVEVKLGSTDTGNNPARDENIRAQFFEVAKFPVARFDVTGLPIAESLPEPGGSARIEIAGTLSLHGAAVALKLPVRVSRDVQNHLHVRNEAPVVLSAHDLGMDAQLAALRAVCGHESLSGAIPIDFDLAFAPIGSD